MKLLPSRRARAIVAVAFGFILAWDPPFLSASNERNCQEAVLDSQQQTQGQLQAECNKSNHKTLVEHKGDQLTNGTTNAKPNDSPAAAQQESIYSAQGGLAQPQEQAPAGQVPGRGQTDKGLYQGLAAGPPGQRYARGLFGGRVFLGGYGSFKFEANNISPAPQFDGLPQMQRSFNSFDFRRLVLTIDASPIDRLRVYTEIEFERLGEIEIERAAVPENRGQSARSGIRFIQEVEGQGSSELAMEQAWAQFDFTENVGFRFGVILPPLGRFNILHDDDYWDIPRRPLVDRGGPVLPVKSAWSEMGAGLIGSVPIGQGYVDYQLYVMNGARLDFAIEEVAALREGRNLVELEPEIFFSAGPMDGSDTADAIGWRVAISPRLGSEIAFSGYHGRYTPDYLNTRAWIHAGGLDGKLTLGNFEIEGEFV